MQRNTSPRPISQARHLAIKVQEPPAQDSRCVSCSCTQALKIVLALQRVCSSKPSNPEAPKPQNTQNPENPTPRKVESESPETLKLPNLEPHPNIPRNLPDQWGTEAHKARAFMTYCNTLTAGPWPQGSGATGHLGPDISGFRTSWNLQGREGGRRRRRRRGLCHAEKQPGSFFKQLAKRPTIDAPACWRRT